MPDREFDPSEDQALLEEVVREAGGIARNFYGGEFKRWQKDNLTPVTDADLAVDRFLISRLRSARPSYGWLSEESADDSSRLAARCAFIVDPIDGTLAFMRNKPHFAVCAAVACSGRPIAGVVYNPITEEFFSARAGNGATCNGMTIRTSSRTEVEGCRMLGDRPMFEHKAWSSLPNIPWPSMHIESRSSIAYRMALVAKGEFDAMMALSPKHDWDVAASEIILAEAGGLVTTHRGEEFLYNGAAPLKPSIIGAGPALHARLLERVKHINLPERRT